MSENKLILRTEQDILDALTMAKAKQAGTTLLSRFLKVSTDGDLTTYSVDYPNAITSRNNFEVAQTNAVTEVETAGLKINYRMIHFIECINGHIVDGDLLKGVRAYFDIDIETGNLPDLGSESRLIAFAHRIATGNAAMVLAGLTPIVDFSAASIALLLTSYLAKIDTRTAAKEAHNNGIVTVNTMTPLALAVAQQVQLEVENHYNHLEASTMRTFTVLWGLKYHTGKEETDVKIICILPDGTTKAAMADLRVGPLLTAAGKPSKEGVKGMADAQGERTLTTTQDGETVVTARIIGCADAHVTITIEAGVAQTVTIHFVAGTSSLG